MVDEATSASVAAPERDGRATWVDILIVVVLGGVGGVVLTIVVGLAVLLIAMWLGYQPASAPALMAGLKLNFAANHIALVVSDLGFLIALWFVARKRNASPLADYFPPVGLSTLALAGLSGLALSLLINGGNELLAYYRLVQFQDSDVERAIQPHNGPQYVAAFAVIALFAPFVEEFFFRGLLFRWLRQAGGVRMAVGVSAVVFGAIHGQMFLHPGVQGWLFTAELMTAGVVLALWTQRAGSLRASFATHAAYNATAILFSALFP
ncbi:MAG TPA: CPBP family intramembrane glutamic endopeptidase [Rhizomicrobium sp.]